MIIILSTIRKYVVLVSGDQEVKQLQSNAYSYRTT